MNAKLNVGVLGCGIISGIYLETMKKFPMLNVAACADIDITRSEQRATEYQIPKVCSVKEMLSDKDIQIILNLTIPKVHAEVSLDILSAGKHLYSEKPLGISYTEATTIIAAAEKAGLRVGCAPDTVLGTGVQTSRRLIDDGWIGKPVSGTAFMAGHGPEGWHTNPFFYYDIGGGPVFDMGPYYLSALITLLGPVHRVFSHTGITYPERMATTSVHFCKKIEVKTATHITGLLEFANGAVITVIFSFDVWAHHLPHIEIFGSEGSLNVPDPNTFSGPVLIKRQATTDWKESALLAPYLGSNYRGLGVADMAQGILLKQPHRANGQVALHVTDIMESLLESGKKESWVTLRSTCEQPAAMPATAVAIGQLG
ncbi:MAG: oxidoreductase [Elusimicrobia bacterium RIFOXYB2_FULL_49_7]|nr:MAG: oxidoreductase [Elusimicrobia bacterium RIFOXYB2_FULL_49_7]